jgi:hypothetical protein
MISASSACDSTSCTCLNCMTAGAEEGAAPTMLSAGLDVRTIAFEALARQSFFRKQYAEDPHFRFHETALEWLKDASRSDRISALSVLPQLYAYDARLPDDLRDALRALATPATGTIRISRVA